MGCGLRLYIYGEFVPINLGVNLAGLDSVNKKTVSIDVTQILLTLHFPLKGNEQGNCQRNFDLRTGIKV